jgi:hypothetical protein
VQEREVDVDVGEVDLDEFGTEVEGWELLKDGRDELRRVDVQAFRDQLPLSIN